MEANIHSIKGAGLDRLAAVVEELTAQDLTQLPDGEAAARVADAVTDLHGGADYKEHLVKVLIGRAFHVARRQASPVTRHALFVLEQTEAVDMTIDTLVCGLLLGETDTSGYPTFDAITGGLASHFDDLTGELVVRAVLGWGGKGQRGDTERNAQRLLSNLQQQILASGLAVGSADAPVSRDAGEGKICGHCGFDARGTGAFYCPKCGMRLGGNA